MLAYQTQISWKEVAVYVELSDRCDDDGRRLVKNTIKGNGATIKTSRTRASVGVDWKGGLTRFFAIFQQKDLDLEPTPGGKLIRRRDDSDLRSQ